MSIFSSIRVPKYKGTSFDLSFENKLTCNMGELIPCFCKEVIPGDKWRVQTNTFIRMSPLRSPIMQSIDAYVHYFFVPNRLLMPEKEWEKFITGGENGDAVVQMPYVTLSDLVNTDGDVGSLADYLGYPVNQTYSTGSGVNNIDLDGNTLKVSTLPLRAVQLIWQDYYRDQNVTPELFNFQDAVPNDGSQTAGYNLADLLSLRRRCWKKDYFSSALPFVQRGGESGVGLAGTADLVMKSDSGYNAIYKIAVLEGGQFSYKAVEDVYPNYRSAEFVTDDYSLSSVSNKMKIIDDNGVEHIHLVTPDITKTTQVDLDSASSVTINDLRRAEALQTWLERNARGGARYIEQILAHFGVISDDARLQRPEYLGGGRQPINISEVLQTSSSDETSPQGNMAGHGISGGQTMAFKRKFKEHGFIIGILSVMPHASYSQGCPKSLTRFDRLQYAFPEFAHLGEQPVLKRELYINGTDKGEGEFGYQSVYADYKYSPDEVHGDFKTSLNFWHLGRLFNGVAKINQQFVECNPSHRIYAVTDNQVDKLWVEMYHDTQAIRKLPKYGTPMMSL